MTVGKVFVRSMIVLFGVVAGAWHMSTPLLAAEEELSCRMPSDCEALLCQAWDEYFYGASSTGVYVQVAEKDGAMNVRCALENNDQARAQRIIVIAFAPADCNPQGWGFYRPDRSFFRVRCDGENSY